MKLKALQKCQHRFQLDVSTFAAADAEAAIVIVAAFQRNHVPINIKFSLSFETIASSCLPIREAQTRTCTLNSLYISLAFSSSTSSKLRSMQMSAAFLFHWHFSSKKRLKFYYTIDAGKLKSPVVCSGDRGYGKNRMPLWIVLFSKVILGSTTLTSADLGQQCSYRTIQIKPIKCSLHNKLTVKVVLVFNSCLCAFEWHRLVA